MTHEEYIQISKQLQQIVKQIPLQWGKVQNDVTDAQLNIFGLKNYFDLEESIKNFKEETKNYCKKRWFVWQCSKCDEYLFCLNENINPNPKQRDSLYDIEINNHLRFDVKGTTIPKQFRNNIDNVFANPQLLINFFYEEQSRGVRYGLQNRLFIVHHSYKKQEREMILRCHFDFKKEAYKQYANSITVNTNFHHYQNAITDIIFIIENFDGSFAYKWLHQ